MAENQVKAKPLTHQDMVILGRMAQNSDPDIRAKYYNYLATKGYRYGQLARSVVLNDSFMGKVANYYAEEVAKSERRKLSDHQWLQISMELMRRDYQTRLEQWSDDPNKPIILKVGDIRNYHSEAFASFNLPHETWTAYIPIELASKKSEDNLWDHMKKYTGTSDLVQIYAAINDLNPRIRNHMIKRFLEGDMEAPIKYGRWLLRTGVASSKAASSLFGVEWEDEVEIYSPEKDHKTIPKTLLLQ